MKFVLAPDKYKGSLTGQEFCDAVETGIRKVFPNASILKKPLADGGDGTLKVVKDYLNAEVVISTVHNPLFKKIQSTYLISENQKIAFIEMSEASGYKLLQPNERNCMYTSSLGTGELILDAMNRGATEIVLGIGGSATNDAGIGMATALGFRFLSDMGQELKPIGSELLRIKKVDRSKVHPQLEEIKFKVACDVSNPLYGENGAAHVYGPQKGASKEEVEELDAGLKNFARIAKETFGVDVQEIPGAGAAGGIGAGAQVFLHASLNSGINLIKDIADFDNSIKDADWVITGEGKLDNQTLSGKTIKGVVESAKKQQIPVAALCGAVTAQQEELHEFGIAYIAAISEHCATETEALTNAYSNLVTAAEQFAKSLQ